MMTLSEAINKVTIREPKFNIDEFIVDPSYKDSMSNVPLHVVDKIMRLHIPILYYSRSKLGVPIYITSGWRSVQYELDKGRNGTSEHTFKGDGAIDMAVDSFADLMKLVAVLYWTGYNRICLYPKQRFIHADFKGDNHNLYIDHGDGWQFVEKRY